MKTPTVVLVTFPRQEQEQSLPEVCQEQEESCQMTLESKCQMAKENKSTDLFFILFQSWEGNCTKREIKHSLRVCQRPNSILS